MNINQTKTHVFENVVDFENALCELTPIIACHFHYEFNAGYIVVALQKEEDYKDENSNS